MDLNLIWFVLLGVLLAGYAVLDGFDLGVGMLHLLARGDDERRTFIATIGPIWDGNEVWLVTFGGALFAAFPEAYATVFSGFYFVFMLVLLALIARAVSLDFRSKTESAAWRQTWDVVFCVSSTLATLLFGVGVGNAMIGVPLDRAGSTRPASSTCSIPMRSAGGPAGGHHVPDARGDLPAPEDDGRTCTIGSIAGRGARMALFVLDVPGGHGGHLVGRPAGDRRRFKRYPVAVAGRGREPGWPLPAFPMPCHRSWSGRAFVASCLTDLCVRPAVGAGLVSEPGDVQIRTRRTA